LLCVTAAAKVSYSPALYFQNQQNASSANSEESRDNEDSSQPVTKNFRKRDGLTTMLIFTVQRRRVQEFSAGKTWQTDMFVTLLSESIFHDLIFQSNLCIQQQRRNFQLIME
jgi:hypothetical protein